MSAALMRLDHNSVRKSEYASVLFSTREVQAHRNLSKSISCIKCKFQDIQQTEDENIISTVSLKRSRASRLSKHLSLYICFHLSYSNYV